MTTEQRTDELQGKIVHEYDGIEEADNELPRWWLAIFYITTLFAVVYWFYYEEFKVGPSQAAAYEVEARERREEAKQRGSQVTDESLRALVRDAATLSAGAALFESNCAVCHGANASGVIGPNLTDKAWISGGAPTAIHKTVSEGVPSKGMPAWEAVLGPDGVRQATAFVLSLRNTNVAGKPPQGDEYQGE